MKKSNIKKIVVSTLALAMGAALAGSVSGSMAFFIYSTRSTLALNGTTVGTSRNIQIASTSGGSTTNVAEYNGSAWGWDLQPATLNANSAADSHAASGNLAPVTPVYDATEKTISSFAGRPIRQYATIPAAVGNEYAQFDLYFQSVDEDNNREAVDLYLTKFVLQSTGGEDITDAVRVALKAEDGTVKILGKTTAASQVVEGNLDLNRDGVNDRDIFEADDRTGLVENPADSGTYQVQSGEPGSYTYTDPTDYITYTTGGEAYPVTAFSEMLVGDGTYDYDKNSSVQPGAGKDGTAYVFEGKTAAKKILTTKTDAPAKLTVIVWLEGFAELDGKTVWSNDYDDATFSLQLRFAAEAEAAA